MSDLENKFFKEWKNHPRRYRTRLLLEPAYGLRSFNGIAKGIEESVKRKNPEVLPEVRRELGFQMHATIVLEGLKFVTYGVLFTPIAYSIAKDMLHYFSK
jgi:hypothetical protein